MYMYMYMYMTSIHVSVCITYTNACTHVQCTCTCMSRAISYIHVHVHVHVHSSVLLSTCVYSPCIAYGAGHAPQSVLVGIELPSICCHCKLHVVYHSVVVGTHRLGVGGGGTVEQIHIHVHLHVKCMILYLYTCFSMCIKGNHAWGNTKNGRKMYIMYIHVHVLVHEKDVMVGPNKPAIPG